MRSFLSNSLARMSQRERRLLVAGGGLFFIFVVFLIIFLTSSSINSLVEEVEINRELLNYIQINKEEFLHRKKENQRLKNRFTKPIPLRTLVDKVGIKLNVTVPDIKELSDHAHGQFWMERSVEITLRNIAIDKLTRFMEEILTYKRKFPIAIIKLTVRKRRREISTYNVEMVISTYERNEKPFSDSNRSKKKNKRKAGK